MSIFKGAGVAIVTPMKNNEEVNYDRLEQMIEYQINQERTVSLSQVQQVRALR